ncbi:MrcB family domain-containing protein [Paenibacillus sp. GYB003]|uniref:MrcB family domain-containing protein n=1 Tax=Paenibacillus sp. GYB003 TaxID=2994392 RepID=UPI002F96776E
MTLPTTLTGIFAHKQKSYKMVLVLAMLDTLEELKKREVPVTLVRARFLKLMQLRESQRLPVDQPPESVGNRWSQVQGFQINGLIQTPMKALSSVLVHDSGKQTLRFTDELQAVWSEQMAQELRELAHRELDSYYEQHRQPIGTSLRDYLHQVMSQYVAAKREPFTNHPLGTLVRHTIPQEINQLPFIDRSRMRIQGSVGMGNWATVPWIAIMDRRNTETTQRGEYIVYLFADDMSAVYLAFHQGVTAPTKEMGKPRAYQYLRQKAAYIRSVLPLEGMRTDEYIQLTASGLGLDYQVSTVAYYRYERDLLPSEEQLVADLRNVVENYKQYVDAEPPARPEEQPQLKPIPVSDQIHIIRAYIKRKGFSYPDHLIENFYLCLKTKPFVILAGVSGTGKTKLVKLFAEALGATSANGQFTLIPVRPDWSDPSDLLGYKDLSGTFRPGKLTEVLVEAAQPDNRNKPYFICLDEMNLARVEHYFSDLLSVLETQEWQGERIVTAPLLHRDSLAIEEDQQTYNLHLPDNVYMIGTVNMDETTHPFSKKVLDRANTIEFNYIHLGQYPGDEDTGTASEIIPASNSLLRSEYLQLVDIYRDNRKLVEETTEKLVKINGILEDIHAHVGFRIRDAICFYMLYNERFGLLDPAAAFDLQLLQKILPRVQGSSTTVRRVLLRLLEEAIGRRLPIQNLMDDPTELFQTGFNVDDAKYPQSAKKIAFMLRRLEEDGFTSYWLS